ncbi:sigma-54-dependent transcriptional regulator [Marinomonas ostreistagni]|uniref:sigma-54-dependent transcriptional regulator n=1 Tax=Marinomonas ostreistagni TaxID=359209 RepID=UPI00194F3B17|nr:sigma-54 dependent transcriptional regulator [Marinomonas ostreistagni]MBM6550900.1 sigma-54-dependent Fis family transcriptional regulator [Marinomonas ostreistagni]
MSVSITSPATLPTSHSLQDNRILIVDDEAGIRDFLQRALSKYYAHVAVASSSEEAETLRQQQHFDVLIVDICMPGRSGVEWIHSARESGCPSEVIFMTAFADLNQAIDVLRLGASDLIIKPFRIEQMRRAVAKCLEHRRLHKENFVLTQQLSRQDNNTGLIGESAVMQSARDFISRIAKAPSAVLIEGETGTGKELAALAIHQQSDRSGAFVPVNCAALAPELVESELFGHVKGAFTNAHQAREGLFSYADGGTLFLDEIAELPLAMQSKLLRVLEDGRIRAVGAERDDPVNVRIVAASNKSLAQAVSSGAFREDLFYRLNVLQLALPALRQRRDDVVLLAQHFIAKLSVELGVSPFSLSPHDQRALQDYAWPGNVRELKNIIERCLLLALTPAQLLTSANDASSSQGYPSQWPLKAVEVAHIEQVLQDCQGNKTKAAERLGITRKTLDRKLTLGEDGGF